MCWSFAMSKIEDFTLSEIRSGRMVLCVEKNVKKDPKVVPVLRIIEARKRDKSQEEERKEECT